MKPLRGGIEFETAEDKKEDAGGNKERKVKLNAQATMLDPSDVYSDEGQTDT